MDIKCRSKRQNYVKATFYTKILDESNLPLAAPYSVGDGIFQICAKCSLGNPLKPTLTLSGPACTSLECTSLRKATKQPLLLKHMLPFDFNVQPTNHLCADNNTQWTVFPCQVFT